MANVPTIVTIGSSKNFGRDWVEFHYLPNAVVFGGCVKTSGEPLIIQRIFCNFAVDIAWMMVICHFSLALGCRCHYLGIVNMMADMPERQMLVHRSIPFDPVGV